MNPAEKAHVLFVDDEQRVLNSMRVMFKREYNLHLTTSGKEALELISSTPVDVVVSDQRVLELEGVDLLEKIKEASPRSVRILLTGYADLDAIQGSINRGEVFRFLTKPCAPEELRETIRQAVEIARDEQATGAMQSAEPEEDPDFADTLQNIPEGIHLDPLGGSCEPMAAGQTLPSLRAAQASSAATDPGLVQESPSQTASGDRPELPKGSSTAPVRSQAPQSPAGKVEAHASNSAPGSAPAQPEGTSIIMEGESVTIVGGDTQKNRAIKPAGTKPAAANRTVQQDDVGVLVFSGDEGLLDTIRQALAERFHVVRASNIVHVTKLLKAVRPGVLITDISEDARVIERMVNALKQHMPELITIVVGDHRDTVGLMNLINHGQIYRFLQKPLATGTCFMTVKAAAQKHKHLLAHPEIARRHAVIVPADEGGSNTVVKSFLERLRSVPRRWTGT